MSKPCGKNGVLEITRGEDFPVIVDLVDSEDLRPIDLSTASEIVVSFIDENNQVQTRKLSLSQVTIVSPVGGRISFIIPSSITSILPWYADGDSSCGDDLVKKQSFEIDITFPGGKRSCYFKDVMHINPNSQDRADAL